MTYESLSELGIVGKLDVEKQSLLEEIKEELESCYYGEEIEKLYGSEIDVEVFRSLIAKYADKDFGSGLGTEGILACEADSTGYLYNLVSNNNIDTTEMMYIHNITRDYTASFILWLIIEKLLDTQIEIVSALEIADKHLQKIGLEELLNDIAQTSYKEGPFELDIIELLHKIDDKKLYKICNSIRSQQITNIDKMVDIFKEEIKFVPLGKAIGQKLDMMGLDTREVSEAAFNNVLYLILNDNTYDEDESEYEKVDITYGNKSASTRPDNSENIYELAYNSYGKTHKAKLDSLNGLELCRLCMIAKATSYTAEEAIELALSDDAYNKFITDICNG